MVAIIVTAIVCTALIVALLIICFKGFKVIYDKTFTIDDHREQYSAEELRRIEKEINDLNLLKPSHAQQSSFDEEPAVGPMDGVIAQIQDLFGPDQNNQQR